MLGLLAATTLNYVLREFLLRYKYLCILELAVEEMKSILKKHLDLVRLFKVANSLGIVNNESNTKYPLRR